ncbi:MAG TPA: DUF222 domain-containing protein [Mycobacteriales bacterium]|nr:DUF222 domain-containing protein [Mycobacteriales bacterium]
MDPTLRSLFGKAAARVAFAEQLPVGARLHLELESLSAMPMDAETTVRVHALWGKVVTHAQARQMIATYATLDAVRDGLVQPQSNEEADMLAAQELACATHLPYSTARTQLDFVRRVSEALPESWQAIDRGDLSLQHLKAVDRATHNCTPQIAEAVDAKVIPLAIERGWTPSETHKAARKLVLTIDAKGAAEREEIARSEADVQFFPQPDGVATIWSTGDAVLSRQVYDAVNHTAEAMGRAGDDRPVGVRRFHALVNAVLGGADASAVNRLQGEVLATGQISTLLGDDDQPGELVGYGPISADHLRRITHDHRLRRLLTDPLNGEVVDLGRHAYAPSARLRKAVQASNPTCTAPGCCRPAIDCETDHRTEFLRGGGTDQGNLKPLCKMHHQLKTKKLWKVDDNGDGTETWTSYLGLRYTVKPRHFPLPDPPPIDDEPPLEIADRLPHAFDPDPPCEDDPLPEPPPLGPEELEAMEHALDQLDAWGDTFEAWCNRHYDEARATGLVA